MAAPHRPFVIPLRRRWVLAILPALCILYFLVVLVLAVQGTKVKGVTTDQLVLGGAALFLVTFLVEIPFFLRRRGARDDGPDAPYEPLDLQDEPPEASVRADDEVALTSESQQGLRVLEYSRPAKSRHKGAVYAKTYVPVTKEHVLRVETLAAEGRDL
jgi:hypothetical protein